MVYNDDFTNEYIERLNTLYKKAKLEKRWEDAHQHFFDASCLIKNQFEERESGYKEAIAVYKEQESKLLERLEVAKRVINSGERVIEKGGKVVKDCRESVEYYEKQIERYEVMNYLYEEFINGLLEVIAKKIIVVKNDKERTAKFNILKETIRNNELTLTAAHYRTKEELANQKLDASITRLRKLISML